MTHPGLRLAPLWWLCGWLLASYVVYASLTPDIGMPSLQVSDKLMHFGGYCALGFWFVGITDRRGYPIVAIGLLALGVSIEVAQHLMGLGRTAEWLDLVANALGIATALGLAYAGLGSWMVWVERRLGLS